MNEEQDSAREQKPQRRRGTRAALIITMICLLYPLSIGPVWRILDWAQAYGWISRDAALGCGFFPYLPLLMLCGKFPPLWKALELYLKLFGLIPTEFIPG